MSNKKNDIQANIDPRYEKILSDLSKRRVESAAAGAALVEKARIIAKQLEQNDIESRLKAIEKQTFDDLNKATMEEMKSLYENQ